jgi:hypothetical protein
MRPMKIRVTILLLTIALVLLGALGRTPNSDPLSWLSTTPRVAGTNRNFEGLRFTIDESNTHCSYETKTTLICQINQRTKEGEIQAQAQIVLQKNPSGGPVGLIHLNRKNQWLKQYPSRNQYVEEDIKIGNFSARLQQLDYFRFGNINWPVLIRAFDVVINKKTSISVTTICEARYWPIIKETMDKIGFFIAKSSE